MRLHYFALALALSMLLAATAPLRAQQGHLKLETPGALSTDDAQRTYERISEELAGNYAISRDPTAKTYLKWQIFNSAPYLSATHGNRYVNNYGNDVAVEGDYGNLAQGQQMPAGSILAKDSFTVTDSGEVYAGALFIMEKLPPGRKPEYGDWRYIQIMPDGSFLGDSEGDNADEVAFCHTCHKAVARKDFLFFVPKKYRRE